MNPPTSKTELSPLAQLRKTVSGSSQQSVKMSLIFAAILLLNVTVDSANDQPLSRMMVPTAASATAIADEVEVQQHGNQWTLRTAQSERVVALENGQLVLKRFTDLTTGRELVANGAAAEEFLSPVVAGTELRIGSAGSWRLIDSKQSKLSQGELQLDITLQRDALQVTKSYVLYPGSSIVREWVTFKNAGTGSAGHLRSVLSQSHRSAGAHGSLRISSWMSGGENNPGSWKLKTESLDPAKPRRFDSYDPFPAEMLGAQQFPGDGIDAKILLNGQQVWPATNWQYVANATVRVPFEFDAEVQPGDKLVFLVNMHGNIGYDTTAFDPTITYADGETHTASKEFSGQARQNGWRYQYLENGKFIDLVYYPAPKQWRKEKDNATGTPFVGVGNQHPDNGQDAARVWTASEGGSHPCYRFGLQHGERRGEQHELRFPAGKRELRPVVCALRQ